MIEGDLVSCCILFQTERAVRLGRDLGCIMYMFKESSTIMQSYGKVTNPWVAKRWISAANIISTRPSQQIEEFCYPWY
jgi:hypothetical protein